MRESKSLALPLGYTPIMKKKGLGKLPIPFYLGWVKGLEPSTPGTTIRCSNQLSYTHHIYILGIDNIFLRRVNGTPEGTRTPGLLLRRQLLYPAELLAHIGAGDGNRTRVPSLEGWCPSRCATPANALRKIVSLDILTWKDFSVKLFPQLFYPILKNIFLGTGVCDAGHGFARQGDPAGQIRFRISNYLPQMQASANSSAITPSGLPVSLDSVRMRSTVL